MDSEIAPQEPIFFLIDIEPKPAARPRFFRGRVHTEPKYKLWQQQCTQLLRLQWDREPLQRVEHIHFVFVAANRRPDIDNLIKACLDSIVYANILKQDNLVVLDSISASYEHTKDYKPCILIRIYE